MYYVNRKIEKNRKSLMLSNLYADLLKKSIFLKIKFQMKKFYSIFLILFLIIFSYKII